MIEVGIDEGDFIVAAALLLLLKLSIQEVLTEQSIAERLDVGRFHASEMTSRSNTLQ
jgi:hypothetical protein